MEVKYRIGGVQYISYEHRPRFQVVKNADGLMKKALESGRLRFSQAREFAASIIQSSIKNVSFISMILFAV